MAPSGNFSCGAFSSCRQTTSGVVSPSQRSRLGRRAVMPLTLYVTIFINSPLTAQLVALNTQLAQNRDAQFLCLGTGESARMLERHGEDRLDARWPGRQHDDAIGQVYGFFDIMRNQQGRM